MSESERKPGLASRIKAPIEFCGKHPFAAGLIGVFGVAFSFVTFGLDRVQSAQDAQETKALASSVEEVRTNVAAIASDATETPATDPVQSHMARDSIGIDNVAFPTPLQGRPLEWFVRNPGSGFSNIFTLQFSLKSVARLEYVQIAPYLVIDVIAAEPIPGNLSALYEPGRGGAEELRSFSTALPAAKGWHYAALTDDMTGELRRDIAYFTLSPREPEEFFLSLAYEPGYIFTYRVGIHYRFKGVDSVHWVTEPMRAGIPATPLPVAIVNGADDATFEERLHPDMEGAAPEQIARDAARYQAAANNGRVFNPRQLNAYRSSSL